MSKELPQGRYLITGGAGFIGSHLSETLLSMGNEVVILDNFVTGRPENIGHLLKDSQCSLIEHDLIEPISIEGALTGIFHLASPASPIDYQKLPIETLRVGSIGSDNILKIAHEKDCPILVTSTSEVYGDPEVHPQTEDYWGNVNPIGPRGCYDESKRYLEAITMAYHRVHNVKTRIVRIFNTYGPRMRVDDGRVVPNFCLQALKGEKITIYGQGEQTRSFCYVSDQVNGLIKLMASDYSYPVNIGNPDEYTIMDFAQRIVGLAGDKSEYEYRPLPTDDPKRRKPNIAKAKELLDWEPQVGLDEGLKETLAYFKSTL